VHGHGRLDLWSKSIEYWMIPSLKIKSYHSWNFQKNWNVPLVLLWWSLWPRFNGIYLVRFGFRMWEILIFKWFLLLKIQTNPKNQVLEGKISWGCGNTWVTGTGHTSVTWKRTFECQTKYDKCTQMHETMWTICKESLLCPKQGCWCRTSQAHHVCHNTRYGWLYWNKLWQTF
jgi:hypothetical protein